MHFNKEELKNSMTVCFDKMADVMSYYDRLDSIERHIISIEEYGPTISDINKDITVESLKQRREGLLYGLMYSMFAANGEYRKKTGKYLMGRKERTLQTAEEIYKALEALV